MGETGGPSDKAGRASGLAARFRRALTAHDEAARRAAEAEQAARQAAQAARTELLAELEAFGREVGALIVDRRGDVLSFRYRERQVVFRAEGDQDHVKVERDESKDEDGRLFRQPELDYRWVYVRKKRIREVRVPLYDAGIEDLLVNALGLPPPSSPDPDPPPDGRGVDRKL